MPLTLDPDCPFCFPSKATVHAPHSSASHSEEATEADTELDTLSPMCLHAYSYQAEGWRYEAQPPAWAQELMESGKTEANSNSQARSEQVLGKRKTTEDSECQQ